VSKRVETHYISVTWHIWGEKCPACRLGSSTVGAVDCIDANRWTWVQRLHSTGDCGGSQSAWRSSVVGFSAVSRAVALPTVQPSGAYPTSHILLFSCSFVPYEPSDSSLHEIDYNDEFWPDGCWLHVDDLSKCYEFTLHISLQDIVPSCHHSLQNN
jgi:hypothetical protein